MTKIIKYVWKNHLTLGGGGEMEKLLVIKNLRYILVYNNNNEYRFNSLSL